MVAQIERRCPDAGFVYTSNTRMVYAPKHTATRKEEDRNSTDIVISCANRWPEPTQAEIGQIREALIKEYSDRVILAETEEGLIPIYEPSK